MTVSKTRSGLVRARKISRRRVLKRPEQPPAAFGAGVIDGFPLVWSQNIKDVTLVQVGGSYSAIIDIAEQATKDLGFKVEMQNAPTMRCSTASRHSPNRSTSPTSSTSCRPSLLRAACCSPST